MSLDYLNEAFKKLDHIILNEEAFNTSMSGMSDLATFMDSDNVDDLVKVIDPEATHEEELSDSYVGKVITNCNICHSNIFSTKEDIKIAEDGTVNAESQCPYCGEMSGFTILGEIIPFNPQEVTEEEDFEDEAEPIKVEVDTEIEPEEDSPIQELDESFDRTSDNCINSYFRDVELGEGWVTFDKALEDLSTLECSISAEELEDFVTTYARTYMISFNNFRVICTPTAPSYETICRALGITEDMLNESDEELHEETLTETHQFKPHTIRLLKLIGSDLLNTNDGLTEAKSPAETKYHKAKIKDLKPGMLITDDTDPDDPTVVPWKVIRVKQKDGDYIITTRPGGESYFDPDDEVYIFDSVDVKARKKADREFWKNECLSEAKSSVETKYHAVPAKNLKRGDLFADSDPDDATTVPWKVLRVKMDTLNDQVVITSRPGGETYFDPEEEVYVYDSVDVKARKKADRDFWKNEDLNESMNNVNVETDDTIVTVMADENGKITVSTEPKNETSDTLTSEIETPESTPSEEGEMISPITDETLTEIEANNAPEEEPSEEEPTEEESSEEELSSEEEDVDIDFEEIDEEGLDELGEAYFTRVYENIDSYKTTEVALSPNKLIVEGVITFKSGNTKKTGFVFQPQEATKSGNLKFLGENLHLSNSKKAFTLTGSVKDNKFLPESFNYNYIIKNVENSNDNISGVITRK